MLSDGGDKIEYPCIKIKGKANNADIMVEVCYRPPSRDDEIDKAICKQL